MNIEEKVKLNLLARGFDKDAQLNNRGLIGATIDETILEVVKNLNIPVVVLRSEQLCVDCQQKPATHGIGDTKTLCKECWNKFAG